MTDVIIIGTGIVGLATGLQLLEKSPHLRVKFLEKEPGPAMHQTGHNSGVIHAGVYYKPGSLKATNCLEGYRKLIDFCTRANVPFELCGKLIVATEAQEVPRLESLFERAQQNGLVRVKKLSASEIKQYEPHASGLAALHVPYTGIINYGELARKYAAILQEKYAVSIHYSHEVTQIEKKHAGVEVITNQGAFEARFIINTAGLYSDQIALMTEDDLDVRIIPFRGEYVELNKEKQYLVRNLIYPVPNPDFPFLGVHFTRLIEGGIEAGPNAVWAFAREGYSFPDFNIKNIVGDLVWPGFRRVMKQYWKTGLGEYYRSFSHKALVRSMQKLVPSIQAGDFREGGAGVRAQACHKSGGLIDDFLIRENKWAINVLNAPSPAATASLAIGETIANLALKRSH
ncbi:MAG: L-2-hydroxyglutarate oxidase [Bacteroidota bacterium]|nr:MAG: L-2-hydroxyglutarate oxidase [Bacteroidota bacterium]